MQTRASTREPARPPARSAPAPATLSRRAPFQAPRCADAFPRLCRRLAAGIGQGGSTPPFQPIESNAVPGRRGLESCPGGSAETQKGPAHAGGVAVAGSCAQAGLRRGKELRGADRAARGAALAGAGVGGREEARGERAASGSASVAAPSTPR